MDNQRITNLTLQELRSMIVQIVDERMAAPGKPYRQHSDRPLSEIIASMRANIIKRQPGEPSVPEMIREERDR